MVLNIIKWVNNWGLNMCRGKMKYISLIFILLCFLFNSIFISFGLNNSGAKSNECQPLLDDIELFNNINPLSNPSIIDLNTGTDYLHHNITIYGADYSDNVGNNLGSCVFIGNNNRGLL